MAKTDETGPFDDAYVAGVKWARERPGLYSRCVPLDAIQQARGDYPLSNAMQGRFLLGVANTLAALPYGNPGENVGKTEPDPVREATDAYVAATRDMSAAERRHEDAKERLMDAAQGMDLARARLGKAHAAVLAAMNAAAGVEEG